MEKLKEFLIENPHYFGLIMIVLGGFVLLCSIFNSDFLFGNPISGDYNLKKVDGLVNFFGRDMARLIMGIVSFLVVAGGCLWFISPFFNK